MTLSEFGDRLASPVNITIMLIVLVMMQDTLTTIVDIDMEFNADNHSS